MLLSLFKLDVLSPNAITALGLLLEARHVWHPLGDDRGLTELLRPELASRRLSEEEVTEAITGLENHVWSQRVPESGALWALGKSADKRVTPSLAETLARFLHDPGHQEIAQQALISLLPFGDPHARAAVRQAAREGQSEVREDAEAFLRVQGLA